LNIELSREKRIAGFVDRPSTQLPSAIRLLGATLKGYMYSIAIVLTEKPKQILKLRLDELLPIVEKGIESKGHFTQFFEYVSNWARIKRSREYALIAFKEGFDALDEIYVWHMKLR